MRSRSVVPTVNGMSLDAEKPGKSAPIEDDKPKPAPKPQPDEDEEDGDIATPKRDRDDEDL